MLQHSLRQQPVAFKDPATTHKIPQAALRVGLPVLSEIGLWKQHTIPVCMKTGVKLWFCWRQLDFSGWCYWSWSSTLKDSLNGQSWWKILLESFFSQPQKKSPNRNRFAADATKEITDIIPYAALNWTSALRLGCFNAQCLRVRFPNLFSYMLEEQRISKVRCIFTNSTIK